MIKGLAGQVIGAELINATTGADFAGTVTVYVTGDGGTQAIGTVGSGICTLEGNGYYTYTPSQAETNYDLIAFTFKGTGAITATTQVATLTSIQSAAIASTSTAGITLKASRLIVNALKMIGVIAGTETPVADIQQDALDRLNRLIDSWNIQRGTIQGVQRFSYPLVVSQGGPSNPYVIGIGQDFSQVRPVWIPTAGIEWGSGTSIAEIGIYIVNTYPEYAALVSKATTNPMPLVLYYEGVNTGNIYLWPVPTSVSYSLVLYVPVAVAQFADYNTTSYTLAPGYQKAIETNLALELLPDFPRDGYAVDPMLVKMASDSLAYIKRSNLDLGLLTCDPALRSQSGGGLYWNGMVGP